MVQAEQLDGDKSKDLKKEKSSKYDYSPGIHESDDNESATPANNATVKNGYGSIGISVNNAIEVIEQ